jgi:hypothetical protein
MGHLFYTELENKGFYSTGGGYQSDYGLTSIGDFEHLTTSWYWSGTDYAAFPSGAWVFGMDDGYQRYGGKTGNGYGLAVRSGEVTYSGGGAEPVPEPATMLLMGTGLACLIGVRRKKKK